MKPPLPFSVWRVLWPVGLGTALSLIGDTSLYAVLPTHAADAAVPVAAIGILLSANRFIRLALNGPVGVLYDRLPRRRLFVPSLFLGALSTAIYALTLGFWPLLLGRLLWGVAWVGIWVGGNTIILDISHAGNRGQRVGVYQLFFFLGASGGAVLGGLLTDILGYHSAMGAGATLTLLGALVALLFLPETRGLRTATGPHAPANLATDTPHHRGQLAAAFGLLGVNRLVMAGILLPTLGLFLSRQFGPSTSIAGLTLGVASLTGVALGANGLISMGSTALFGGWSDRAGSRWGVAAAGLLPGFAGFGLLAAASPLLALVGIPLTAMTGGSNQSLSTALVGDLSNERQRGKRLGMLYTVGDLASAVGPPLAYGVISWVGLDVVYWLCAVLLGVMALVSLRWAAAR